MVKRKATKKSDDISNWAVVLMLVAVIVVSTLSIVLFMDAAEESYEIQAVSDGEVSLEIVNEASSSDDLSNESEKVVQSASSGGEVELQILE